MANRLMLEGLSAPAAEDLALMTVAALEGALILARAARSDSPVLQIAESLGRLADARA